MPLRALYRQDSWQKRFAKRLLPLIAALGLSSLALILTLTLPDLGDKPFFSLFFAVAITCSWLYGFFAGLLCVGIGALGVLFFLLPPLRTWRIQSKEDVVRFLTFQLMTIASAWVVSKLRRTQQELALAHERFQLAHELAKIWAWELDPATGQFLWSSRGTTKGEMEYESAQDLFQHIHPEDQSRVTAHLKEAADKKHRYEIEFRLLSANEEVRWVASVGESFRAPGGNQTVIGVNVDITSRKRAEETMQAAAKGALAGRLAHEINSPLQSLLHSLYLVRALASQPETHTYAELAHTEAERVSRLLNEILELYAKH